MKIIQSKNYLYKEIVKESQVDREKFHNQLQIVIELVSQGTDTHRAIAQEFGDMPEMNVEKIKYFVLGALGMDVSNYTAA